MLYDCHQSRLMSNIRRLISVTCADVWYQLYNRRRLLSYNCYHGSDVWFYLLCYITVIRHLVSNIRRLITVIWQQTFDVRGLLSYHCYQTSDDVMLHDSSHLMSDVWCYMLCYITVIRRLMSNIRRLITVVPERNEQNDFKKRYKRAVKGLAAAVAYFGCFALYWKALWQR